MRKDESYRSADAEYNGQITVTHCNLCKQTLNYRPVDLIAALGNERTHEIERYFSCQRCGKKEYIRSKLRSVGTDEYGRLPMRKLVRVYFVKKTEWTDGVL